MVDFYGRVLGLERLEGGARGGPRAGITFFRLGVSFGGHVAVLALFEDSGDVASGDAASSLHHLALSLPWEEQEVAKLCLEQQGFPAHFQDFDWAGWRGLFTRDPDGNTVELVAASPDWHVV